MHKPLSIRVSAHKVVVVVAVAVAVVVVAVAVAVVVVVVAVVVVTPVVFSQSRSGRKSSNSWWFLRCFETLGAKKHCKYRCCLRLGNPKPRYEVMFPCKSHKTHVNYSVLGLLLGFVTGWRGGGLGGSYNE